MPVTPKQMSVDAKLQIHVFDEIDRSGAAASVGPILYHPTRDIIVESVAAESTEAHVVAVGTYKIGTSASSFHYGLITVPITDSIGDITEGTVQRRRIPRGTKAWANHTSSANAGKAKVHVRYYLDQTNSDVEAAYGEND